MGGAEARGIGAARSVGKVVVGELDLLVGLKGKRAVLFLGAGDRNRGLHAGDLDVRGLFHKGKAVGALLLHLLNLIRGNFRVKVAFTHDRLAAVLEVGLQQLFHRLVHRDLGALGHRQVRFGAIGNQLQRPFARISGRVRRRQRLWALRSAFRAGRCRESSQGPRGNQAKGKDRAQGYAKKSLRGFHIRPPGVASITLRSKPHRAASCTRL